MSKQQASERIPRQLIFRGVSFRTLNRWLAQGTLKPSQGVPYGGGRTLWLWTDADIAKGRKINATLKPGPKPAAKRKGRKP